MLLKQKKRLLEVISKPRDADITIKDTANIQESADNFILRLFAKDTCRTKDAWIKVVLEDIPRCVIGMKGKFDAKEQTVTSSEEEMEAPTKTDPAVETEDTPQREVHQMR